MSATMQAPSADVAAGAAGAIAPASTPRRGVRVRRHLGIVPPAPRRAARGPFIAVLAAVLGLGLLVILALNTVLAQGSFAAFDLRAENARLADQEQVLLRQVAAAESPEQLERAARSLGMVPAANPVFLRLSDGKVLGVPVPAAAPAPPRPAPKPAAAEPATRTAGDKPADKPAAKKAEEKAEEKAEKKPAQESDRATTRQEGR
jgi:hypothetical protein